MAKTEPASASISQATSVLEQHRELHLVLDEIRICLERIRNQAAAKWLATIDSCLSRLLPQLEAHFDLEERGALFEEIEDALPDSGAACAELRGEHQHLLSEVAGLREGVEMASAEDAIEPLAGRCRGLVALLGRHEERENELLFRALGDEIGAQD